MWTVTIKTRKAIPGLAKVLLAVVLLGSFMFAVHVQNLKQGFFKVNLDTPLRLPTETDVISLNISSKWVKRTLLSSGNDVLGIWEIPSGDNRQSKNSFLFINLLTSQESPERDFAALARVNRWLNRLDRSKFLLEENTESGLPYPIADAFDILVDPSGPMVVVTKLIYLPNGTVLGLSILTPYERQMRGGYWLDEIAKTLKFIPYTPDKQMTQNNAEIRNTIEGVI
jgi:hypothetical protein